MANQTMQGLAGILAEQGRYGDTMLMHVAPSEVEYLAGLGGITQNPMTGLPEAFKFKDLLPFVGSAFLGPAFKAVGFSPGVSSFLATTASTMLGGGSLEKGIMSGLVSSSIGRLGQNLSDTAQGLSPEAIKARDSGYRFGIIKDIPKGSPSFSERYAEAFRSPQFNPVEMAKAAGEGGLENFLQQVQKPSVMLPFTIGAGELGRIKAEEDYARQYQNFLEDQAERRRKIRERNPQILPPSSPYYRPPGMAQGGEVQRKYDGYSFDPFSFDEYIPDAIMPGDATPVGVGSLTPIDEPAMPSEEWFLWSDGTYNRLPEETGIRTPYDQLPDTYKARDARGQQPEAPVEANQPLIDEPYYQEPVPATTPVPEEPVYTPSMPTSTPLDEVNQPQPLPARKPDSGAVPSIFVDGFTPDPEFRIGEGDYDAMQKVMASLSLMDSSALNPLMATSFADPNIAATSEYRQDTRPYGAAGSMYEEGALEAAKASAADPTTGIFSEGFQQLLAEDPEGTQAAIDAKKARDLAGIEKIESEYSVMKPLSDLLKANKFQEAFAFAKENDIVDRLMDTNVLRQLRPAFTQDEMKAFFEAMPPDYAGGKFEFDPAGGASRSTDPYGTGQGMEMAYPDPTQAYKRKDDKTFENIAKVAAAVMLSTAIPGIGSLFSGSGATAGGAAAGGAGALTGVVPTGLVSGTTAAAVAAAGVPLAEVAIIASKLALTVPEAVALISSVGLTGAQAFAGGATTPATTVAQTTPTQPTGLETPLDEVVVTGKRAIDRALLRLVPGSLASTNLIQGMTDIPTNIYGQVEGQPDLTEGKIEATEAQQPQEPFKDRLAEVIVTGSKYQPGILDLATIGTSGLTAAELLKGYTEPTLRPYEELPPEVDTNLDEVVVTGSRPLPISLTGLGAAGLTANQLMQGFTQPNINPVTGEPVKTPEVEQIDLTKPEPSILDTLLDRGRGALTDLATSQLLGSLAGGLAGGAAGGVGAGGGGYTGTGGLGVIPEGQERRYLAAPGDYRHGFLPEFLFFENLNPPAVDLTAPGTTPGTTPGTPGGRPGGGDETIEPKATGGKIKSYSPRGYLDLIQGYQAGGEIEEIEEEVAEYSEAPMTDGSRGLIQLAQAAILGQLPEDQTDDVIQKFIDLHGNKAFRELRENTLESVSNGSRKEGMIEGHTGGMDDMVEGVIGGSERVAVSPGEFIIPADVVSMLGDGNSDSGRTKLEQMMSRVRKDKTGSTKQAKPINSAKVLPA